MTVEFEEYNAGSNRFQSHVSEQSKFSFISLLIKIGVAKDEKTAEKILIGTLVLFIVATLLIIYLFVITPGNRPVPLEEIYR